MFALKKKETADMPAKSSATSAPNTTGQQSGARPAPSADYISSMRPKPAMPIPNRGLSATHAPMPTVSAQHTASMPSQPATFARPSGAPTATQEAPALSASAESKYARPTQSVAPNENGNQYAPPPEHRKEREEAAAAKANGEVQDNYEPHTETLPNGDRVFKAKSVGDVKFADCWYTPEGINYIRDKTTKFALIRFEAEDQDEFLRALEQGYTGSSSYALRFAGENYRVERVVTVTGVQYNCRKMPTETPNLYKLGIPDNITRYLATLATESGLILFGGPTGMGKTTTASALMKEFLEQHGGFLYTIEDPPEMPLDGLYRSRNGALGLCKQCPVENEHWEDGIKSALRSKPRYILVGEIRSPEVASQVLRAATSGHLVLSTIHATSVEDALNSIIKYAMGAGLDQQLVTDLLARGILAVVHQKLEGTTVLHPVISTVFANPNPLAPDQLRNAIREGRISLGTLMEAQSTRLFKGMSMFKEM